MDQNMKNIDFNTFLLYLQNHGLYWNKSVIFEFPGTFLIRSIWYFAQSCFIFWENTQSLHKVQGCSAPLNNYSCMINFPTFEEDSSLWTQTSFSMTQDNSGPYDENNGEENEGCQIHVSQPAVCGGLLLEINKRSIALVIELLLFVPRVKK